jgi:hypothetical protein
MVIACYLTFMAGVILHWRDKQKSHTAQARLSEEKGEHVAVHVEDRETTDRKVAEV